MFSFVGGAGFAVFVNYIGMKKETKRRKGLEREREREGEGEGESAN